MHETLLDQLPPLIELKMFLSRLTLSGSTAKSQSLLLEDIPQIQEELMKDVEQNGGFYQIAQEQDSVFLNKNKEDICALASRLSKAYGTELLCELEQNMEDLKVDEPKDSGAGGDGGVEHSCATCEGKAKKKCASCKQVHYCSRWVGLLLLIVKSLHNQYIFLPLVIASSRIGHSTSWSALKTNLSPALITKNSLD